MIPSDEAEKFPKILITLINSRVRSEDDLMFSCQNHSEIIFI